MKLQFKPKTPKFWIFTFNKRVFDLYRRLGQRLKVRSLARQEERQRLRLKAAMVRQQSQSQSLTVADLDVQTNKLTNMMAWLARSRKESGASEVSTSTQATTVKAVSGRWDTLTEEYEDRLSGLDQVTRAFVSLLSHHHTISHTSFTNDLLITVILAGGWYVPTGEQRGRV